MLKQIQILLLFPFLLIGQSSPIQPISPELLKKDLSILKKNLEALHTDLYLRSDKATIDSVFQSIEQELTDSLTPMAFFHKLRRLNLYIRNGHTNMIPHGYYFSEYFQERIIPFDFRILNNHLFVLKSMSDESVIQPGDEILAIDGKESSEIISILSQNFPLEGNSSQLALHHTENSFSYLLMHEFGIKQSYTLKIKSIKGEEKERIIQTVTEKEKETAFLKRYGRENPLLPMTVKIENNYTTLTINTFDKVAFSKQGGKYNKQFKSLFQQIRDANVSHLVVDVRKNTGGFNEVVEELMRYFSDVPFHLYDEVYIKRIPFKEVNKKYIRGNLLIGKVLANVYMKKEKLFYTPSKYAKRKNYWQTETKTPYENRFKGKVYVLIGRETFSAGAEFAGLLKHYANATIVGEETSGNPKKVVAGTSLTLVLPHSKTSVFIPIITTVTSIDKPIEDRGLTPDYVVTPSIEAILKSKDEQLLFVKDLIRNNGHL